MLRTVLAVLVVLFATGCTRSTPLPGLQIDESGELTRRDADQVRQRFESVIGDDLTAALGEDWRVSVVISPDPHENPDYEDHRHWWWPTAEVTVTLTGPGDSEPALGNAAVADIAGARLRPHLPQPDRLTVRIRR